jgi:DNA-binding MarR family transcriptional regulator
MPRRTGRRSKTQVPAWLARLPNGIAALRKGGFKTIDEASVFCAALAKPTTIRDMEQNLGMTCVTISRVVFRLFERGWLTYSAHPTDRRKKLISAVVERLT